MTSLPASISHQTAPGTNPDQSKLMVSFQITEHTALVARQAPVVVDEVYLAHELSPQKLGAVLTDLTKYEADKATFTQSMSAKLKELKTGSYYSILPAIVLQKPLNRQQGLRTSKAEKKLMGTPRHIHTAEGAKLAVAHLYASAVNTFAQAEIGGSSIDLNQTKLSITTGVLGDIEEKLGPVSTGIDAKEGEVLRPDDLTSLADGRTIAFQGASYCLSDDKVPVLLQTHWEQLPTFGRRDKLPEVKLVVAEVDAGNTAVDRTALERPDVTRRALEQARLNDGGFAKAGIRPDKEYLLLSVNVEYKVRAKPSEVKAIDAQLTYERTVGIATGVELVAFARSLTVSLFEASGVKMDGLRLLNAPAYFPAQLLRKQAEEAQVTMPPAPAQSPAEVSIPLDSITGKRYVLAEVEHLITQKLQILPHRLVAPETATQIERLLNGQKTDVVLVNDGTVGKLYLSTSPDTIAIQQIDVQSKLTFKDEFLGHQFTESDKANLNKYGNMGRKVELVDKFGGPKFEAYLGVDKATNKICVVRADKVVIPRVLKGATLNAEQKKGLAEGKAVRIDGMTGNDNMVFNAYVRYHAGEQKMKFNKVKESVNMTAKVAPHPTPDQ